MLVVAPALALLLVVSVGTAMGSGGGVGDVATRVKVSVLDSVSGVKVGVGGFSLACLTRFFHDAAEVQRRHL